MQHSVGSNSMENTFSLPNRFSCKIRRIRRKQNRYLFFFFLLHLKNLSHWSKDVDLFCTVLFELDFFLEPYRTLFTHSQSTYKTFIYREPPMIKRMHYPNKEYCQTTYTEHFILLPRNTNVLNFTRENLIRVTHYGRGTIYTKYSVIIESNLWYVLFSGSNGWSLRTIKT